MLARQGILLFRFPDCAISALMKVASGRIISSGIHAGGNSTMKRATSGSSTTTTAPTETLGSAVKLGAARDKERKEKEDVELKPPWDLLPYSRDISAGTNLAPQKIPFLIPGYPDFYPSKGSEEEYKLTEKAITEGFENKPLVSVLLTSPPFRSF